MLMYCSKCGQYCDDNEKFCGACGSPLTVTSDDNEAKASMRTSLMVWGIVAAALAVDIPIAGIIVSVIARRKVANYHLMYGSCTGKARVGETLSTVALVLSIAATVLSIIIIIAYGELVYNIFKYIE